MTYHEAVSAMLEAYPDNDWFHRSYWPENERRVGSVIKNALERFPDPGNTSVMEIGCANGYVALLFRLMGFDVKAMDACEDPHRAAVFSSRGIGFERVNLNDVNPLGEAEPSSCDLVLLGEVFEHVLNEPFRLLENIHRMLRPGGVLILTTPNPSTLANAVRVLCDCYLPWGTTEFLKETKIDGSRVIDTGNIHYREYPGWVVVDLLRDAGFGDCRLEYVMVGVSPGQHWAKRFAKKSLMLLGMGAWRLTAMNYVITAVKPPGCMDAGSERAEPPVHQPRG